MKNHEKQNNMTILFQTRNMQIYPNCSIFFTLIILNSNTNVKEMFSFKCNYIDFFALKVK